jgi:hypothetical protein
MRAVGPVGFSAVRGTETEEDERGSPLEDLIDEALLPVPLALLVAIRGAFFSASQLQRKNSPKHELYGLQGLPLTYFRSLVNQKRRTSSMRSRGSSAVPMATKAPGQSR